MSHISVTSCCGAPGSHVPGLKRVGEGSPASCVPASPGGCQAYLSPCGGLGISGHRFTVSQCCHLVTCACMFTRLLCPSTAIWWPVYISVYILAVPQSHHVVTWTCMFECLLCSSAVTRLPGHTCSHALCVLMLGSLVSSHAVMLGFSSRTNTCVCAI